MTDTPERLWLWPEDPEDGLDKFFSFPDQPYPSGSTEYIRADVARADAQAAAPVAWKYRWKIDGEYVGWRYSDASNAHPSLDGYEEQLLYSAPVGLLRADAQAAVALALEQAANEIDCGCQDGVCRFAHACPKSDVDAIRALAPADALAEVQRLREENARIKSLLTPPDDVPSVTIDAIIYGSGALDRFSGDEPLVPADALNVARAERDAALARVEKLRCQITEASDPDFLFGAMDNVNDMDVTLDQFAAAVSRAIRAAMEDAE